MLPYICRRVDPRRRSSPSAAPTNLTVSPRMPPPPHHAAVAPVPLPAAAATAPTSAEMQVLSRRDPRRRVLVPLPSVTDTPLGAKLAADSAASMPSQFQQGSSRLQPLSVDRTGLATTPLQPVASNNAAGAASVRYRYRRAKIGRWFK
jgi:hypothetical protein